MTPLFTSLLRSSKVRAFALGALAAGTLSLSAPAFAQSMSDKAVESEIEFARGLARDWTFVELAQGVLDGVAANKPSDRMKGELALVRCELFAIGASRVDDPTEANALFERGYAAYKDYIDSNKTADNRDEAEAGLVKLSIDYSASIDAALEEAAGEEAETLSARKLELIEDAISLNSALVDELAGVKSSERTPDQNLRRWILMLQKGDLYSERTKLLGDPFSKESAIEAYEELSFDAGLASEFALRADAGIGNVYMSQGEPDIALEYYTGMVDNVLPMDPSVREEKLGWSDLPLEIKEKRFNYVELGMAGIQKAARASGQNDLGIEFGLFMYNMYRIEGFSLSTYGHEALLGIASTMVETGGFVGGDLGDGKGKWYATEEAMQAEVKRRNQRQSAVEFALQLVNQVAEDTSRSSTKVKAGKLLEEINSRPDIEISANQLLEAAKGKRLAQEWSGALGAYYAVLQRMDTMEQQERLTLGTEVYGGIAEVLRRQGRSYEAAVTYREAIENWPDILINTRHAKGWRSALKNWGDESGTKGTPEYERHLKLAEDAVIRFADPDQGPDDILYSQGNKALTRNDFDGALEKFRQISVGTPVYDPAQVRIGQTLVKSGNGGEGVRHLIDFIDNYATDPANAPGSPKGEDTRKESLARATYYLGVILHKSATSKFKKSDGSNVAGFNAVVSRTKSFAGDFPKHKHVAVVQSLLVDSHAKLGDAANAAIVLDQLVQAFPDSPYTGSAALDLYKTYEAKRETLAGADPKDEEAIDGLTRKMADSLAIYNGVAPRAGYIYLNNEADLWLQLQEWGTAKPVLERIVNLFQEDEKFGNRVVKFGIPDLAETMLELGEVNEAKALLTPFVFGADPILKTQRPVMLTASAMIGSVVGSGTNVKQNPGAGGTDEEFAYITDRLDRLAKLNEKWSCEWYEGKFISAYAYYTWGQRDDRKKDFAKKIIDNIVTFAEGDTQFTEVDTKCARPDVSERMRKRLGQGVLASRFRWLFARTR